MTDPTPATFTTAAMAGWARDEVREAAAVLLAEVHDIDFHHYGDGPADWLYEQGTDELAAEVVDLADRLHTAAAATLAAVTAALARRDWLTAGRPVRCIGCDEPIDPTWEAWQVCRGLPEHTGCHRDDPTAEDADRALTVEEAEQAAHWEDRTRTGSPRPGDIVKVTYPDASGMYAVWQTAPDGTATARTDDYHGRPVDLTTAVGVEVVELAEDIGVYGPDGTGIDPDLVALMSQAVCGICDQPLTAPAVWARSYPVHRHCAPAPATTENPATQEETR